MDRKICQDAQLKLLDTGSGSVSFYVSTFGNWDLTRPIPERPVKGAFTPYLPDFIRDGFLGASHDWGFLEQVGMITNAVEDDHGLRVDATFHGTAAGQAARQITQERMAAGKSVKSSMGYNPLTSRLVEMTDPELLKQGINQGRELLAIPMYEASLVTVPANPLADVLGVKGLPAGLKLSTHSEQTLASLQGLLIRYQGLSARRAKEGRVLSTANRAKLQGFDDMLADMRAMIADLLAASEPAKAVDAADLVAAFYRQHLIHTGAINV